MNGNDTLCGMVGRTRATPLLAALAVLATLGTAAVPTGRAIKPIRELAVTFDDLPYVVVDGRNQLDDAQKATDGILRVLSKHHAPAVAFVNASKLDVPGEADKRIALLKQWAQAGVVLGNHTYSHLDFNASSVQAFEDDILKGRIESARLEPSRPSELFFRYPENHTGNTAGKKAAVEGFLTERGYTVAKHTVDGEDYLFNIAYLRSLRRGDRATAARVRTAYSSFAMAATAFAETVSRQLFGREVPQSILLHANDLNGAALGDLLDAYEARGYRFVSLADAMRDPAYETPDTIVTAFGPTWLWRWNKSKGLNVSFTADPEPPDWVLALTRSD